MSLLLGAECLVDALRVVLDSLLLVAASFVCTAYRGPIHFGDATDLILEEAVGENHGTALARPFAYSKST
jgi:hypothetical protein